MEEFQSRVSSVLAADQLDAASIDDLLSSVILTKVELPEHDSLLRVPAPLLLLVKQERPAIADKPARRESLPKIAPIWRAYNVVADNTGLSLCV